MQLRAERNHVKESVTKSEFTYLLINWLYDTKKNK